jgi:hypothetical protein
MREKLRCANFLLMQCIVDSRGSTICDNLIFLDVYLHCGRSYALCVKTQGSEPISITTMHTFITHDVLFGFNCIFLPFTSTWSLGIVVYACLILKWGLFSFDFWFGRWFSLARHRCIFEVLLLFCFKTIFYILIYWTAFLDYFFPFPAYILPVVISFSLKVFVF